MGPFIGLSQEEKKQLKYEIVSNYVRSKLTRILRSNCHSSDVNIEILRINKFINIAKTILMKPIYILTADDKGDYHVAEHAWHNGQLELILKSPTTEELAEILGDYLQGDLIDIGDINNVLVEEGVSFYYKKRWNNDIDIIIYNIDEIEESENQEEIPNIRILIHRMERSLESEDYAAVLHASASVFETLAKDVVGIPRVQNQTLGGFIQGYKKRSALPDEIVNYMLSVYDKRNTEPLAGHGHLSAPTINREEAITLAELTKAIVKMERKLTFLEVTL